MHGSMGSSRTDGNIARILLVAVSTINVTTLVPVLTGTRP